MSITINSPVVISANWSEFINTIINKFLLIQYYDDGISYSIFAFDGPLAHTCKIWKAAVPAGVILSGYSQIQNDIDKIDFENNYKQAANNSVTDIDKIRRRLVSVNFRKELISSSTYYLLIDLDNDSGYYKHADGYNLKIAGIHGVIIKDTSTDQWVVTAGVVLSINSSNATIGWLRFGTQNVRDTGIFQHEIALTLFPFLSDMSVSEGTFNKIADNYVQTTTDLSTLINIEDASGTSRPVEVGDFILRTNKISGIGTLLFHYHIWYFVE